MRMNTFMIQPSFQFSQLVTSSTESNSQNQKRYLKPFYLKTQLLAKVKLGDKIPAYNMYVKNLDQFRGRNSQSLNSTSPLRKTQQLKMQSTFPCQLTISFNLSFLSSIRICISRTYSISRQADNVMESLLDGRLEDRAEYAILYNIDAIV